MLNKSKILKSIIFDTKNIFLKGYIKKIFNKFFHKKLKKETDEIVGRVNGEYATVNWTPIWYYYRSMDFDELIDLYSSADIAMITPIRDGMNLVAKEFVSTRINGDGVLILSELAGASKELFQALTVNPFDINSMS